MATPLPEGISAAASATPTGARGNVPRESQCSVSGLNTTCGSTWTVAVSRRPPAVVSASVPETALSGTVVRTTWSFQSAGEATGAVTSPPPPARANVTAPPP
ncbi:MAG: hypothetical protein AUH07_01060 [Gemmatimonadetes bacterium 13_2_20CM_70_9]|nr:MAG: hypothetical protein AUH07_01060 [Gemmatimonadetes bacterium 13_2_20CM_70_9]